jgi:hypothetical protein
MFEYSAPHIVHLTQSSSRNSMGFPQKSQGSPSSEMSKLIFAPIYLGVAGW